MGEELLKLVSGSILFLETFLILSLADIFS